MIKCCHGCVPPKRHEKCHDHCPDYNTEIIMNIVASAESEKKKRVAHSIYVQKTNGVHRAIKKHGSNRKNKKENK